jgi:hypothetical protein
MTIDQQPYQQVPGHPSASYRTGNDNTGRFWIQCQCSACGDFWQKQCFRPQLANNHIYRYATIHGHGVRPVHQRRR